MKTGFSHPTCDTVVKTEVNWAEGLRLVIADYELIDSADFTDCKG